MATFPSISKVINLLNLELEETITLAKQLMNLRNYLTTTSLNVEALLTSIKQF